MRLRLLLALLAIAVIVPTAHAFRLPEQLLPMKGNPANRLAALAPDPIAYDAGARRRLWDVSERLTRG